MTGGKLLADDFKKDRNYSCLFVENKNKLQYNDIT